MAETIFLLVGLFFIPTAYLVGLIAYGYTKFKYRTTLALVESGEELPLNSAANIVVLTKYRYDRLVSFLKFLATVYACIFAGSLAVIYRYFSPGKGLTKGLELFVIIALVSAVMFLGSIIRIKTMHIDIGRFLDENRFETFDPIFIRQERERIRRNETRRPRRGDSGLDRMINNNLVDKVLPRRYSENPLVRKVTGRVIKELLVKVAVTVLLMVLGIKSLR